MISFIVETRTPPQAVQCSWETMLRKSVGAPRGVGRDVAPAILDLKRSGHVIEMLVAMPLLRYAKEWWLRATREHQPMAAKPALVPLTTLLRAREAVAAEHAGLARRTIASANPITYALRAASLAAWQWASPSTLVLPRVGLISLVACAPALLAVHFVRQHRARRLARRVEVLADASPASGVEAQPFFVHGFRVRPPFWIALVVRLWIRGKVMP